MLVGILSDTHGDEAAAAAAVKLLCGRGVRMLLHCGDVGSPMVLWKLMGAPAAFVWGNCDYDRHGLENVARRLGIRCCGSFGELEIDGKRVALMHGDDAALKRRILTDQRHDYLLQGHTHVADEQRIGRVHLVNPGALHRARERTVALLDTERDAVESLAVAK